MPEVSKVECESVGGKQQRDKGKEGEEKIEKGNNRETEQKFV